jgi:hypothetical protein
LQSSPVSHSSQVSSYFYSLLDSFCIFTSLAVIVLLLLNAVVCFHSCAEVLFSHLYSAVGFLLFHTTVKSFSCFTRLYKGYLVSHDCIKFLLFHIARHSGKSSSHKVWLKLKRSVKSQREVWSKLAVRFLPEKRGFSLQKSSKEHNFLAILILNTYTVAQRDFAT